METNNICSSQNEENNLVFLKAQRRLYSLAKKVSIVDFSISIPLVIFCGILANVFSQFQVWYSFISLAVIFISLLLKSRSESLRLEAAKIQGKFDENVLTIKTNNFLIGDKISYENVKHNASRISATDSNGLVNWYPDAVKKLPLQYARLVCQRSSCHWNFSQRKFFITAIKLIALFSATVILCIGIVMSTTLADVLLLIVLPSIPVIQWAARQISDHQNAIELLGQLRTSFDNLFANIFEKRISERDLEIVGAQIQDAIFVRRSTDPLIPNFLYWFLRKDLEEGMQFSAETLVLEIKNVI